MVFVGFLLVAAAITVGAGVLLANTDSAQLVVFGQDVPFVSNEWQVFAAGAVVAAVFVIGMMFTFMGAGRILRARRDLRELRDEHEESLTTLEMEKRRLERELARVRQGKGGTPPPERPSPGRSASRPGPQVWPPHPAPAPAGQGPSVNSPFFDRKE
ncbi:hypothetical protein [Actinomadura algeriensis]|uniref:Integral membrane protein n=1 Tax=Actinomadura algeriensis TaxID=1679523 RepID=A0ABR9JPS9_9ACTN|nr:hypothetical protein [Actinomadura algeriensis]MBE1532580.1 putative integral membrane protein [Actinomadura algeriensis]